MSALLLGARSPLRIGGTTLPPNVLLAAKLVIVCLLLKEYLGKIPEPFLPLVPAVDALPRPDLVRLALQGTFLLGATGLMLNVRVRTSALLAGGVVLLGPLVARGVYTNGDFFCACMLILIGLFDRRHGIAFLRAQFVLLYFGSALNKLLEPDWLDGRYMEYWLVTLRGSEAYATATSWFPAMWLSTSMGWATIVTELVLAGALAIPRFVRPAIWLALLFHGSSLLLSGNDFGIFFSVLLAGLLVFVHWPGAGEVEIRHPSGSRAAALLRWASRWTDADRRFRWTALDEPRAVASGASGARLVLTLHGRTYPGISAVNLWLLLQPAFYFALAVLVAWPYGSLTWIRHATVALGIVWFCPLTPLVLDAVRRAFARGRLAGPALGHG